ncbi:hypothetical protein AGLY_009416, partial [Aphis glycines]
MAISSRSVKSSVVLRYSIRPKIPPIYVYNISDYENFHTSVANITFDNFSIVNTKSALKINLNSIDDYRTATKLFDKTEIEYHTYQLPENRQLSVVIRNLPVNISEACIYNELQELKFEVASVTRLQNQFKSSIPIVAVLLSKSSTEIFSLNRFLHCIIIVEPRKPSKDIPQCTNCQRFSHTKKFCHLLSRCVKCAGDHHYSQCQKSLEVPPKCVNCDRDHPANYRGCTFYKEISRTKNKNKTSTNLSHSKIHTNTIPNTNTQNIHSNKDNTNVQYTYASACNSNTAPFVCVHEPLIELDSDHIPVKITINSPSLFRRTNNLLLKGKPDWNRLSNHVQSNLKIPTSIPTTQIAEHTADLLTDVITEAAQSCSNFIPQNIHSPGNLPHSISSLIRRKHLARRTWQNHRNPTDKKILNLLTKEVQAALQNYRVSSYNSYLLNMRPGEANLWKATKRLLNQDINTIPPLRTDAKLVVSDLEKCNVVSNMLYNTFSPNHICNPINDQR